MHETTPTSRLAVPVDESRDHIQGPADALVTLVEYADFDCPFRGMAYGDLKEFDPAWAMVCGPGRPAGRPAQ
jgi:protein-disulfide isomerase